MHTQQLALAIGQCSSAGRKPVNQDFHGVLVPSGAQLRTKGIAVALADGISSSSVSQVASETAVNSFLQDYYCTSEAWSVKTSAQRVLKATNSWLYAQTRNSPYRYDKDKGYICTFSGMVFKSTTAHVFHCGDSRVFRMAGDALEQLTQDHRHVVSEDTSYLTRALGFHDTLEMDYIDIAVARGDTFVLATDGVYEFLAAKTIAQHIRQCEDLNSAARRLVAEALDAGSDDNLTVQIVRVEDLPSGEVSELQQQVGVLPLPPPLSARMRFDGFVIVRQLYVSSRSHVYLAQDEDSGEKVVLKTPSVERRDEREYLESFLMEEWVARRIDNPHVLKAFVPKCTRNFLYIATEYIDGVTLAQWMIDNPAPDIETVRNIAAQIASGLRAFHRQEMVHQDIRPNNIMIDRLGTVRIIDFGATRVAGISEITAWNEGLVGTAQFTAPEYFRGERGTAASDLFSLGVIVYKMLTGKLPYGNAIARSRDSRSQRRLVYQPMQRHAPNDIPGWLDHAVSRATDINPARRYEDVAEFIYDLRVPAAEYLNSTRPPLVERNPVLFWQGVSLFLLGVVVFQNL